MVHPTPWSLSSRSIKRWFVGVCELTSVGHLASSGSHSNISADYPVQFFHYEHSKLVQRRDLQGE